MVPKALQPQHTTSKTQLNGFQWNKWLLQFSWIYIFQFILALVHHAAYGQSLKTKPVIPNHRSA